MLRTVLRAATRSVVALAVALIVASCGSDSSDNASVSGLDDDTPGLLPAPTAAPTVAVAPAVEPTPSPEAIAVAVEPEPIEPPSMLACLSRRARVAQLLVPLATQPELAGAQVFAADGELGGIGLLGAPDEGIAAAITSLQHASFVPLMIASDEEGGSVQRLGDLLGPIPSARSSAQNKTPADVRNQWVEYGARVRALGIDVVFGPVLDVGSAPGIESRSFGDDPALVATYGRAVAEGLAEAGVMPVFKHFPGHGRASADSHLELPTTPPLAELRTLDLLPYVELLADPQFVDRAAVMIGHLSVPGLSDEVPTSLSPEAVTGLLRTELGFGGLIFTDAMNMGAIINTYGRLEAIELALWAGADVAILGSLADLTPTLDYLVERSEADANFAAVIDNRAVRVLVSKGQASLCAGAQ